MQVLGDAIEGTKGLDQQKIADYIRDNTFNTVVGDVKFGKKGEWDKARILTVQFQNITGTSVDDFRGGKGEVVVWPGGVQGRRRDPAVHRSQGEIGEFSPSSPLSRRGSGDDDERDRRTTLAMSACGKAEISELSGAAAIAAPQTKPAGRRLAQPGRLSRRLRSGTAILDDKAPKCRYPGLRVADIADGAERDLQPLRAAARR